MDDEAKQRATDLYLESKQLLFEGDIEGVNLLKEAAELGNPYAQNDYAQIVNTGDLVYRDQNEAFEWFRKAAESGIDEAQFYMGLAFYEGTFRKKNYKEALKWFRVSAEKGYPDAQYYIGRCYYNGEGVFKDYGFATRWFTLASEKGSAVARIALADVLMDLNNPERDYKRGFKLYKLASEAGEVKGHYKLGMCYYNGKGVPQNLIEASKCFRKGLENGKDPDCEYMLGMMYVKGEGVQKNHNQGVLMLSHAAVSGNDNARAFLDRIAPAGRRSSKVDMPTIKKEPNTPDFIGGIKGASDDKGLFGFLRKKL